MQPTTGYLYECFYTLTRPERFTNTTRVFGSKISFVEPEEYGLLLFSGFVFRGDRRSPPIIFREGFIPQPGAHDAGMTLGERMRDYTGSGSGITGKAGVSTTICAHVAQKYLVPLKSSTAFGYVYLIDARYMTGYAIRTPRPRDNLVTAFPILKTIYEVNFTHQIRGSSIVGTLWSPSDTLSPSHDGFGSVWNTSLKELTLGLNPTFEGGSTGAEEIMKRFNL